MAESTSAGAAFGARQSLENEYERLAAAEVESFLGEVRGFALAGTLSALVVFAAWASMLDRIETKHASRSLVTFLRESKVPDVALAAASNAVSASTSLGEQAAQLRQQVSQALGLTKAPKTTGAAFGRLLGPDGALSWAGDSAAAARTAATADFGQEMLRLGREEGYTHKRWMTRYDSRVRETHENADRQTVPLEGEFVVGTTTMRYPGDMLAGDVGEVVNCRCVLALVRFGQHELDHPAGTEPWNNPRPV